MKCLNCGKNLSEEQMFSFQVGGRINVGYDCDCGYTSFQNYLETTPPIVDNIDDFYSAIISKGGTAEYIDNAVHFKINDFGFITEILSQCDFDFEILFRQAGVEIRGIFHEI
jgi:hypothetical protein